MKRDWDLIRQILLKVEALENTRTALEADKVNPKKTEEVSYQMQLLIEAELVKGDCDRSIGAPLDCFVMRLTWEGHEFLDSIKNDSQWDKTKDFIAEKGANLSFETIKVAVGQLVRSMFA
tara:strand:+ start:32 stop:391 length:360 start_codon:yes stop_codon:yes gene_type:complete